MASLPTLAYWDIRGLAEPIRYLLRYANIPFNDKKYEFAEEKWKSDKVNLGLDFPNLPYYVDGNIKLTQSLTILRHLARKHGLVPTDEPSLARVELAEQQIQDIRMSFFPLIVGDDIEDQKQKFITETLVPHLQAFSKFLGTNAWVSAQISYVDFLIYETLDWFRLFTPETIEKFATLRAYLKRFEDLPPIKAYQSSKEFKSWPLFGPVCKWGSA